MRRIPKHVAAVAMVLTATVLLGACAGADDDALVVFAASSLSVVMDDVADQYEAAHPGISIQISYSGSPALREQIVAGAPADVVVLASESTMQQLTDAALVGPPRTVATNTITLATSLTRANSFESLESTLDPRHLLGMCAATVPCGVTARVALNRAAVEAQPDTETPNVRALVALLLDDELDLALIYRTDVAASDGALVALDFLAGVDPTIYPAAVIVATRNSATAESFVEFLGSQTALDLFAAKGFGPPP